MHGLTDLSSASVPRGLTARILNLVSSVAYSPGILVTDPSSQVPFNSPGTSHPARMLHNLPPKIGRLLLSFDKVFPHKVVHALEQGMLEYIPLDLLTDKACH